jgi:hypothetical protein
VRLEIVEDLAGLDGGQALPQRTGAHRRLLLSRLSPYAATKMTSPSSKLSFSGLTAMKRFSFSPASSWNSGRPRPVSPTTMPENDAGP